MDLDTPSALNYAAIIKEIGRGARGARPIPRAQAETLFAAILDGKVPDMELGAILLCMRIKGEDHEEMLGFKDAMDKRTARLSIPAGPRCIVLPSYNGTRTQANLMPVVALILAREGLPVLIHSRYDFTHRDDPLRLLATLGIEPAASIECAQTQLATQRLCLLKLETLNPGLDRLLALRPRLGLRNSGHSLAKLLDPLPGASVRVVAVTHPDYMQRMERLLASEPGTALLMRGTEGEAYAAPHRRPRMRGFEQGIATIVCEPESTDCDPRFNRQNSSLEENVRLIRDVFDGNLNLPSSLQDQLQALRKLAGAG